MDRAEFAAAQWQKENPELDSLPMLTIGRLSELASHISQNEFEPFFATHDLHPGEFDVIATLRRSGSPFALTLTQLYKATMVSSGGMTNRIDRLEKAGLVERKPNPDDRRGIIVSLTARGVHKVETLVKLHIENEKRMLSALTAEEIKEFNRLTKKLLAGLVEQRAI